MRNYVIFAVVLALSSPHLFSPLPVQDIYLAESGTVTDSQSVTFNYWLYTNPAYPCGEQGYHQFLVLQSGTTLDTRHLLVDHRGGGAGFYYNSQASYWPTQSFIGTLDQSENRTVMFNQALADGLAKEIRNMPGWRLLLPSYCSHDLYYGQGQYSAEDGFARWGYLADAAAIRYTVANFPTSNLITYGTSAGASGAFYQGIAQPNVAGIVMDSNAVDNLSVVQSCQAGIQPYQADWPCTCAGASCGQTLSNRIGFSLGYDEPYLEIQRGQVHVPIYLVWNQYDQVWNFQNAHLQFDRLMGALQQYNPGGRSVGSMVCFTYQKPCAVHSPTLYDGPPATSIYNWILGLTQGAFQISLPNIQKN